MQKERISSSVSLLIMTNIIVIAMGILLTLWVSKIISRHLNKVVHITTEIANGNLTVDSIGYEGKDEIGQLAAAVHQMQQSIRSILFKVTDASGAVTSQSEILTQSAFEVNQVSEQIATTMEELSIGTDTQANSLADLSTNMNDFTVSVRGSEQGGQKLPLHQQRSSN